MIALAPLSAQAAFSQAEIGAAKSALVNADRGKWDAAHGIAERARFPLLQKLVEWLDLTRPAAIPDFNRASRFIEQNPDWPSQVLLRKRAEDGITDATPPDAVVAWFAKQPRPLGAYGAGRYIDALSATGQQAQAAATARQYLADGTLIGTQFGNFVQRYGALFRPADFQLRADRLVWEGNFEDAKMVLPFLTIEDRAVVQARIALATQSNDAQQKLGALTAEQRNDLGVIFERLRWLRRQDRDAEAMTLLTVAPPVVPHPEIWGTERAILARRALARNDAKTAYDLARDHRQAEGAALADGEWMAGWIALRFLNDPKAALAHFDGMLKQVSTPVSVSRAAYWAGRAAEAEGDQAGAHDYYERASAHLGSFYGQLALAKLNPSSKLMLPPQPSTSSPEARAFANHELVRIAELLAATGHADRADSFVRRVADLAQTPNDALLAMRLAKSTQSVPAGVVVAKRLVQGGMPLLTDGYPIVDKLQPKEPEPALIHAIIRQESLFDRQAVSSSGALGMMQLMPATAKSVAGKLKLKKHTTTRLTADPQYNITLGSNYLEGLIDRFGGSYVYAVAGYNAGPNRVAGWLRNNGARPSTLEDTIDWIEEIDVSETRNYVQRVMENIGIYRARLGGGSAPNRIVQDLMRGPSG